MAPYSAAAAWELVKAPTQTKKATNNPKDALIDPSINSVAAYLSSDVGEMRIIVLKDAYFHAPSLATVAHPIEDHHTIAVNPA